MPKHSVRISFPTEASLKRFIGWMSDGGGEYQFFESEDDHEVPDNRIVAFDYARGPDGRVITALTDPDIDK